MKIKREVAVAMFVALGFKTADKWPGERLVQKLEKLQEVVKPDVLEKMDDAALKTTINKALEAAKNEDGFIILGEDPKAEEAPAEKPAKGGKKAAADKPAKEEKPAKEKKEKQEKPAKPEKEPGPPGVRYTRSRPYLAGVLIKKLGGLKAGITEEHVKQLDEAYGKENPAESMFCLRNAWHAARGYTEGNVADLDPSKAEPEAA